MRKQNQHSKTHGLPQPSKKGPLEEKNIKEGATLASLIRKEYNRGKRLELIGRLAAVPGDAAWGHLLELLRGQNPTLRMDAAKVLMDTGGPETADALTASIASFDIMSMPTCLSILAEIGHTGTIDALLDMGDNALHYSTPTLEKHLEKIRRRQRLKRRQAIGENYFLSLIPPSTTDEIEKTARKRLNWRGNYRKSIMNRLIGLRSAAIVPYLIEALTLGSVDIRLMAVEALADYKSPEVIQTLCRALRDLEPRPALKAVDVLKSFGTDTIQSLFEIATSTEVWTTRERALEIVYSFGNAAFDVILAQLKHLEEDNLLHVLHAMGYSDLDEERALTILKELITWENPVYRRCAAIAMRHYPKEEVLEPLLHLLHDPDHSVRLKVAACLAYLDNDRGLPILLENVMTGAGETDRFSVIFTLRNCPLRNVEIVDRLMETCKKGDNLYRQYVADILGLYGNLKAVDLLWELTEDEDKYVREHAVSALAKLGDCRIAPRLIKLCKEGDPYLAEALDTLREKQLTRDEHLLCRHCRTRSRKMNSDRFHVTQWMDEDFPQHYACRSCETNLYLETGIEKVQLVLDETDAAIRDPQRKKGELVFYWQEKEQIPDYDQLYIHCVSDYRIKKFVMALRNDMDDYRVKRLDTVPLFIAPGLRLSPAVMNLLRDNFNLRSRA